MSNTPLVITSTEQLSAIADAILARAGNPKLTKNTVLNLMASGIAGPKRNWGSLKAQNSPVLGQGLSLDMLTSSEGSDGRPTHLSVCEAGITVRFTHPSPNELITPEVLLHPVEAVMAFNALFGPQAPQVFRSAQMNLEIEGHAVVATCLLQTRSNPRPKLATAEIPAQEFKSLFNGHADAIWKALVATDAGEDAHTAFVRISQSQAEIPDYQRDGETEEAFQARINTACRRAVLRYISEGASDRSRRNLLRRGSPYGIVSDIIDHHWPILLEGLAET